MGGSFNLENVRGTLIGVGNHAKGTNKIVGASPQLAEVERMLQELKALLAEHATEIDDKANAQQALAKVQQELRSEEPRQGKLRKWLSAVGDAAPGVSAIAQAVAAIRSALTSL